MQETIIQIIPNINKYQLLTFDIQITNQPDKIIYNCKKGPNSLIFEIFIISNIHASILEFHTDPEHSNIGKPLFCYMLKEIVKLCKNSGKQTFIISGFLSNADHNNGKWPGSLIAYKRFAEQFGLEFYITDMKTETAYINCPATLKKDRYEEILDFYSPAKGKINSGYLHYSGNIYTIAISIEKCQKNIEEYKDYVDSLNSEAMQKRIEQKKKIDEEIYYAVKHPLLAKLKLFKQIFKK